MNSGLDESYSLLSSIKEHLVPGTYFCVYKGYLGAEHWSEIVLSKKEQEKIKKDLERRRIVSKITSGLRKHGDTLVILVTIILGTLWIKLSI